MEVSTKTLSLNYTNVMKHIAEGDLEKIEPEVKKARELLETKKGPGSEYLGWLELPASISKSEIDDIQRTAVEIIGNTDAFIVVGIGGSYLGARAVLESILSSYHNESGMYESKQYPKIYYTGCNISSEQMHDLLDLVKKKRVTINVVSKSGTTTEPALAFRVISDQIVKRFGKEEAKRRVIATTDKSKGSLKTLADREGYRTFVIPDDVGGRFSVLTPVGLLPIAVGGVDIKELLKGAQDFRQKSKEQEMKKNPALMYAALRNILLKKGRGIEILAGFEPSLHYIGEWWKQLYGESEGKNHKGIYPDYLDFTTDLHSMGQWIQDGVRSIFETFLWISESRKEVVIPGEEQDLDKLNYLKGKSFHYVNEKAYLGVASAHMDGGVPNMTLKLPKLTPYHIGQLVFFFEYAVAISGYMLGVNPFDQPGVENYKKNMFALLGKPGFEEEQKKLTTSAGSQSVYEV